MSRIHASNGDHPSCCSHTLGPRSPRQWSFDRWPICWWPICQISGLDESTYFFDSWGLSKFHSRINDVPFACRLHRFSCWLQPGNICSLVEHVGCHICFLNLPAYTSAMRLFLGLFSQNCNSSTSRKIEDPALQWCHLDRWQILMILAKFLKLSMKRFWKLEFGRLKFEWVLYFRLLQISEFLLTQGYTHIYLYDVCM